MPRLRWLFHMRSGRVVMPRSAQAIFQRLQLRSLGPSAPLRQDVFHDAENAVTRDFFPPLVAIEPKQLVELGRGISQPVAIDDLDQPAGLEKSTGLGDRGGRAFPVRLDGFTRLWRRGW